jgi:hypothetical protein
MTAILSSQDLIECSEWLAEGTDIPVTSNFEQVRAEIKLGLITKVVIMNGAINCSTVKNGMYVHAKTAYDALKKEFPSLSVKVLTGWPWKIRKKDLFFLPVGIEEFRQILEE